MTPWSIFQRYAIIRRWISQKRCKTQLLSRPLILGANLYGLLNCVINDDLNQPLRSLHVVCRLVYLTHFHFCTHIHAVVIICVCQIFIKETACLLLSESKFSRLFVLISDRKSRRSPNEGWRCRWRWVTFEGHFRYYKWLHCLHLKKDTADKVYEVNYNSRNVMCEQLLVCLYLTTVPSQLQRLDVTCVQLFQLRYRIRSERLYDAERDRLAIVSCSNSHMLEIIA